MVSIAPTEPLFMLYGCRTAAWGLNHFFRSTYSHLGLE
jgi:hypothetical protein